MARLTDEDRELILADYHTGHYTQRELAKKYECSTATVNKLTKGKEPKHEQNVNAIVTATAQIHSESEQNEHEVNAVNFVVEEKTRHLKLINNLTERNLVSMGEKITPDRTIFEHESIQKTIHKAGQTLGVVDQFAPKIDVTQLQQQGSTTTTVEIIEDKVE